MTEDVLESMTTHRQRSERHAPFLAEIGKQLVRTMDPDEAIATIVDSVGQYFKAEWCVLDEVGAERIVHSEYHAGVSSLQGYQLSPTDLLALREGRTVIVSDTDSRPPVSYGSAYSPGIHSYIAVPQFRDRQWVATLSVLSCKPRSWQADDVNLLKTIAELVWLTVERLRLFEGVRESEQRLQAVYERAGIGICEADLDGRFLRVNSRFCDITGYSREELLMMSFQDITHPEDVKADVSEYHRLQAGEIEFHQMEKRYIRKDNRVVWINLTGSLVRLAGKPRHGIGAIEDITKRKQAEAERQQVEEALRQSEERYRCLVTATSSIVGITTGYGAIAADISSWQNFTGQTPEQYKGFGWLNAVHPNDRQPAAEVWHRAFQHKTPLEAEYRLRRYDGEYRYVMARSVPILDTSGSVREWVGTIEDISDRKQVEEQVRASLREKEVLLKEIHHRVKNNLQVICSLLRLQSEYLNDEQALKVLAASQLRVESMALIHQKLYQSNDMSSIDAADYIRSLVVAVLRSYNISQHVSLAVDAEDVILRPDTAVPCSLILCELISNALKHAFPNQKNACINVQLHVEGDRFLLRVSDNGIGMPENLDFRNSESLGLQLVMDLVEQLEGTISLLRQGGTTFEIRFMPSVQEN